MNVRRMNYLITLALLALVVSACTTAMSQAQNFSGYLTLKEDHLEPGKQYFWIELCDSGTSYTVESLPRGTKVLPSTGKKSMNGVVGGHVDVEGISLNYWYIQFQGIPRNDLLKGNFINITQIISVEKNNRQCPALDEEAYYAQ